MTRATRGARNAVAGLAALAAVLAAPAAARAGAAQRLDVPLHTPVYRVPDDATVPDGRYDYRVRWAGIVVGRASITLRSQDGPGVIAVDVSGRTHPAIEWLYRYRMLAHGLVRTAPFAPHHWVVDQCEHGKHQRLEVRFPSSGRDPVRGIRHKKGRVDEYVFDSDNTYDIPSATFLLLSLDYAPGDRFELDTFTGRTRHLLRAEVEGAERITAAGREHDALRLRLETRDLTSRRDHRRHRETLLWVSAQRPRQVLHARSRTWVGSLTLELEGRSDPGLATRARGGLLGGASCI